MDLIQEGLRLTALSQTTRLQTITVELALAFTWCEIAKTELGFGEHDRCKASVAKIEHAAASLCQRMEDPAHLAPAALADLQPTLKRLKLEIRKLKATLDS